MLATAHNKPGPARRPDRPGRCDGAHCAAGLCGQGPYAGPGVASAGQGGLPLLTAAYKPATPQRPPLCTFAPSRPLKHHGAIP